MRTEVRVPTVLQDIVGGSRAVPAEGETVEEIFDSMESRYPGFKARLIDEKGGIHDFVSLCLNDEDIAVSTRSACASGSLRASHVLLSIGLEYADAQGTLVITFRVDNTEEDIIRFLTVL